MSLGAKLRVLRARKGESLQQVANAVGVSKPHIWEIETGRSGNPSFDLVKRLAEHFGVGMSYFVDDASDQGVIHFFRELKGLTEEDLEILRDMAQHLKKRSASDSKNES